LFTDSTATPTRVEVLLDLIHSKPRIARDEAKALLQPASVYPEAKRQQATDTIAAALQLKLLEEDARGHMRLVDGAGGDSREMLLEALDREVLAKEDVEPYFARFFAFSLGAPGVRSNTEWADQFNATVYGEAVVADRFNPTKLSGLWRWVSYAGLGWFDPAENFQPCPYERIKRQLPHIFKKDQKLPDDKFMERLAACCPEIDGGAIYRAVFPGRTEKQCTPGLAAALTELHLDKVIRLHCPPDSSGWSIAAAEPPPDGETLLGNRIQFAERLSSAGK
jgi:hypothetical protein